MASLHRVTRVWLRYAIVPAVMTLAPLEGTSQAQGTLTLGLGASSRDSLVDRQENGARGNAWVMGSHTSSIGNIELGITLSLDGSDGTWSARGSELNTRTGNWVIGFGAVDRHWSFSPNTSLILSDNAEPLPSLFLRTDEAIEFSHPLLHWIGPITGEIFIGHDGRDAGEGDVRFFGARLILEPAPGLEFELVRTAQFTGGFEALGDVLLGETNEGKSAEANQMAGLGASWQRDHTRLYAQVVGEDEAGGLPSCLMYLAGFERQSLLAGFETRLNLEIIDTRIDRTEHGFCGPNTAYNNGRHPYTRSGIVMGAPIDSEGHAVHLMAQHDLGEHIFDWGLGQYTINDASSNRHRLSSARVTGPVAHVGLSNGGPGKRIGGRVTYQGFDLDRENILQGVTLSVFAERQF